MLQQRVSQVINEQILPALEMDGTGVEVLGVEGGIVQVRFTGGCGSCPGSVHVIVRGIEEELRKHLPEVDYLEVVA